jgi:C4-dicarboxylate-specific signal transduction histidine kinase
MSSAPSLRAQILASLGTLLVLAFLPLFFAVANIARATAAGPANDELALRAQSLSHRIFDARKTGTLARVVEQEGGMQDVVAICVTDKYTGALLAKTALPDDWPDCASVSTHASVAAGRPGYMESLLDMDDTRTRVRFRAPDAEARTAPLLRLIALYIFLFGAVLLAFAYLALTRLIVRPIDLLSREAERVASGARKFRAPERGPREIAELGASVKSMTDALVANEAILKKKIDELEKATNHLRETRSQLVASERLAGVGKLAAGIAHEIGNPISAILGMLDLISDDTLPADERKEFLKRTQKETERISNIVKDLLDFARPEKALESGPTSLRLAASTVEGAVRDVLSLVRSQKSFKMITVDTHVEPGLVVTLPQPRLEQVLLNLMLNAGHALEKVQSATITVKAEKKGDDVVLTVTDNGPGVPKDARASIFEPFFTTKDVGEGTGLGLSVCRGLVEAVGGTIALDESHENGARFRLTLPLAPT